jgi:type IV secretory pathway TrbL component
MLTAKGAVVTNASTTEIEFKVIEFTGTYFQIFHPFFGIQRGKIDFNNNGEHTEIIVTPIGSASSNVIEWVKRILFAVFIILMWVSLIRIHGIILGAIFGTFATLFLVGVLFIFSYAIAKINYFAFRKLLLNR